MKELTESLQAFRLRYNDEKVARDPTSMPMYAKGMMRPAQCTILHGVLTAYRRCELEDEARRNCTIGPKMPLPNGLDGGLVERPEWHRL